MKLTDRTNAFFVNIFALVLFVFTAPELLTAQNRTSEANLVVKPAELVLNVGAEHQLEATTYAAGGEVLPDTVVFYSRSRKSVDVTQEGTVTALKPGRFEIIAIGVNSSTRRVIPVRVKYPPLERIEAKTIPKNIYTGTVIPLEFSVIDSMGMIRDEVEIKFSSSNPSAAEVDRFGRLTAKNPGRFSLIAEADGITATWSRSVRPNPVEKVVLETDAEEVRTGDVVRLSARPVTASGTLVPDAPVRYAFVSEPDDNLGEGATAQIEQDGRFVANKPGLYTIIAQSGPASAQQTIRVNNRNIQKNLQVIGHGKVLDKHTSDLWVWEGIDGRDYAVTGTWGAAGEAYFWDVTNPAEMQIIDTVTVDARTVNDVKISEDGRIGVLTREGASDRKNGIVILDVSNPHNVKIITEYDQGLTGGVHNAFIWDNHVFAVNNGRRYDIINIEDPENPVTVSRFELDTPGHAVHDVWVENGIAYSSNWDDGVVVVDVGSTPRAGTPEQHRVGAGSPANPVRLGSYAYPSGWNHAAFPFKSRSTGNFYVIAGDEAFPNGLNIKDDPTIPAGWIHFIKFEGGWDRPREVARYQVPEAGTHNFWVKNDTLYVAYYNAGLRVVDISGELMGNLYDQGREIAKYIPMHPQSIVPNAAFTWGPQPYKGYIFLSDWNTGLWALKLEDTGGTESR